MDLHEENRKKMVEDYIAAYNAMDGEGMVRDLTPDVVFEHITNNEQTLRLEGVEAFKAQVEMAISYFSERKQTIQSCEFGEDLLRLEIDYEAVLAKDLPNGLKAGERLSLSGVSEFSFEKGKIKRIRDIS